MQSDLFAHAETAASIPGLYYQPAFLSQEEEARLLALVQSLPLAPARYKDYLARRQVVGFGGSYDFDTNTLLPGRELDERLLPLRDRVAAWLGVEAASLRHALVAQYAPGTPLGWHRDVPDFERIAGVSLGSAAVLRFRPYPPGQTGKRSSFDLDVAPRSIYRMEGSARWDWQHCVPPVKGLRWSITFRTLRHLGRELGHLSPTRPALRAPAR